MAFSFFRFFRKITAGILVIFSIGCLAAVFITRLPDQEVCIALYQYTSRSAAEMIFDSSSGRLNAETRNGNGTGFIGSPDGKQYVYLKSVPHETDLYDIYVQAQELSAKPHLLQHAVYYAGGNVQLLAEQLRWSRDSKQIAFLWSNSDQDFFLSIANIDNDQIKTITPFGKDPTKAYYTHLQEWSADNRYISIIDQILNYTHYSFWDTATLTVVDYPLSTTSMVRGAWSPQGHIFASILRDDNLKPTHLMLLNPEQSSAIIQSPLPKIDIQHLMWSPDSKALVIGYLTCKEANCQQQWHYALFQSDGTPLTMDLEGSIVNSANTSGDTEYGSDGRTSYSGYPFNAAWSSDGTRFSYLQQTSTGDNPTYGVGAFDLDKRQAITLATYQAVNFSNKFFHTLRYTSVSSRIMEAIPYIPLTDQMIIPYMENGKINVALNEGNLQKPIQLVSGADQLIALPMAFWQGEYWATDWNGNDHILIEWSTGQGKDKHLKLTTADSDGTNIHTVDENLDDILNMNFIGDQQHPKLGFIGKKDEQYDLYMLDLDSGQQTVILEDVEDNANWEASMSPQQNLMAIRGNILPPGGGTLYLHPIESDAVTKVDADPRSGIVWSDDGEKIALINGHSSGSQDVLIIGKDGKPIKQYPISLDNTQNFIPQHWSKCY